MENLIQRDFLLWSAFILLATPLLVVLLGELIERLRARGSPYITFWLAVRGLFLPLLVAFLITIQLVAAPPTDLPVRLLQTFLWLVAGWTLLALLRAIGKAGLDRTRWEAAVPSLVRGLLQIAVIALPIYYVLTAIWSVPLSNLFTALGVGSLVIALALQDTLSNLVSGLLLVLDRPFEVGDQIEVEGKVGKVVALSWRSVRLKVAGRDMLVVPNSALSGDAIYNFTAMDPGYRDMVTIGFSYNDPPNKCIELLEQCALGLPHILEDTPPRAILESFDDSSIRYDLYFYVATFKSPMEAKVIRSDLRTRIFYAAQRAGLDIPFPIVTLNRPAAQDDAAEQRATARVSDQLQHHYLFADLPLQAIDRLARRAEVVTYGRGEDILREGESSPGLYLIQEGRAELSLGMRAEQPPASTLGPGDLFGETMLFGNRPSPSTITARTDLTLLFIGRETIRKSIEAHPHFVLPLDRLAAERQSLLSGSGERDERQLSPR